MAETASTEIVETPAEMKFRLISPDEGGFLKHIVWNKDELEAAVRAKVAEYEGIVYTEETVRSAKKDRAELNALFKAIEDRRKKVKSILNQPYAEFEAEVREVTSLITKQSAEIGKQIEEFEMRQKEEKKAKLQEAYEGIIGDLAKVLPFEKVFDPRYLNQTFRLDAAVSEIQGKILKVKNDLATIDGVCTKHTLNAKDVYVRTMDLSRALAEEKRLNDLEEKLEAERVRKEQEAEERRKAEEARVAAEAARKAEEEARRLEEERRATEERAFREAEEQIATAMNYPADVSKMVAEPENGEAIPIEPKQPVSGSMVEVPEKKVRARFYVVGTREQLKALTQYMKDNGIMYGKVD